ncbi:MAG: transposase [Actinomycetia bacterium]|nr:transposase [Actinomycetes bacterium]
MSLDADLKKLADAAIADWPDISFSGQFDAEIRNLYRSHLQFPPSWSEDEREEFIESNADMAAIQLSDKFDDAIDSTIDQHVRWYGVLPHREDATTAVQAARMAAIYELEFYLAEHSREIAEIAAHRLGRTVASMTGCSPASRRLQAAFKPPRHRRRKRR